MASPFRRRVNPARVVPERIQKLLANHGIASRRRIEGWIREGRLDVNGHKARLGDRAESTDHFKLDGKLLSLKSRASQKTGRVLILDKPLGIICSRSDPQGRQSVFDLLPKIRAGRWISVGRLDINTSGLLLFSDDGELVARLMHPKYRLRRVYHCRIDGNPDDVQLQRLQSGIDIAGNVCLFEQIRSLGGKGRNRRFEVSLSEGRNREVRRLWEAIGFKVSRLRRVAYGPVRLPARLASGSCIELAESELSRLYRAVNLA